MRRSLNWMDDAACTEIGLEPFFPDPNINAKRAKESCGRCPVKADCIAYALSFPGEIDGIWGGTSKRERRSMKQDAA